MPSGYRMPPHSHPVDEHVEVMTGALLVGIGDEMDPRPHHRGGETRLRVTFMGPCTITYLHPNEAPGRLNVPFGYRRGIPPALCCQCFPPDSDLWMRAPTSRIPGRRPLFPEPPMPTPRTPRGSISAAVAVLTLLTGCGQDLPTAGTRTDLTLSSITPDILVSTTADDGPGSLRQAIADVADGGVIGFEPALAGGTIVLAERLLIEGKSLTIEGPADEGITLDGDGVSRIFTVLADGGLTVRNATLTGSYSSLGALSSSGIVRVENSTITGNHAVEQGSSGDGFGGGIVIFGGSLTVVNSTISGNVSDQRGGGVASLGGSVTLIHTTVTGNSAPDDRGGGIYMNDGTLTIQNSIIAGNLASSDPNCALGLISPFDRTLIGTNLLGGEDCGPRAEDIVTADPGVGPLADNGGPTRTHALLPGSPAIETAAQGCAAIPTDQRYVTRPQGSHCDIGAFEFAGFVVPPLSVDAGGTVNPGTGTALVSGRITCPAPATLTVRVTLRQSQKIARVNTVVEATADVPVVCTGSQPWAAALAPATGAFRSGTGTVTARTLGGPVYLQAAEASRQVKLGWARK